MAEDHGLGWRADGISRALAAGGIPLERYRRPGFERGIGVRPVRDGLEVIGSGWSVNAGWKQPGPDPELRKS